MMWAFIKKYFGWRDWAVLVYNSIFENLFVLLYILVREQKWTTQDLTATIVFLLFSMFSTTYGYLINDYADMELDRRHGKSNTFENDSRGRALWITMLFLFLSVATGWYFSDRMTFLELWLAWIFISTFYSLPPLRFKERGKPGLLLVVLAQRLLPVLLVFTAFDFHRTGEMVLLAVYVFFRGISSDVNHQVEDYENDIKTGTSTFAVSSGRRVARGMLRFSLEMEKVLLLIVLLYITHALAWMDFLPLLCWLLTVLLYVGMLLFGYKQQWVDQKDPNPFSHPGTVFQFLHHSYPSVILSLVLSLILVYFEPVFILLFIFLLWVRRVFSLEMIKKSFVYNVIRKAGRDA